MKLLSHVLLLLVLVACVAAAPGAGPAAGRGVGAPPATRPALDIYLLMGQSNMVGRDTSTLAGQVDDPRILAFTAENEWVVAREPITPQVGNIAVGMGPGISFAGAMRKADAGRAVGLVGCAVGGTPLRRWVKGGDLYEAAVARAKRAAAAGTIRGVLWHQGESDADAQANAETYKARLTQMFKDLRTDLNLPELPIVVGQVGDFLPVEKHPYVETVRAALRGMPEALPRVGYADAKGLTDKGDALHFTAASQVTFGTRYAEAMLTLQAARAATQPAPGGRR
jgi:hypothetical protein